MSGGTLTIEGLSVARGARTIIHALTLDVPAGQVAAMLGPNGAGKSTLALALAGMLRCRHLGCARRSSPAAGTIG
jgi:ABC-type cobalamin/Fe3+-siderophores transport system ATPase subunit